MESQERIHINNDWIWTILWSLYHSDYILARQVHIKEGEIIISFQFPVYKKVINCLSHVSANQIHEAVMEWTYIAIGIALSQWRFWELLSFEDFLSSQSIALYREVSMKFKRQIHQWEEVKLSFWIGEDDIKDAKWKFSTATVHFSGFVEWQSKSCLQANDFVREVILQKS